VEQELISHQHAPNFVLKEMKIASKFPASEAAG
jgi:hypothetical protein